MIWKCIFTMQKANMVANTLSRKAHYHRRMMESCTTTLCGELSRVSMKIVPPGNLSHISVEPTLQDQIIMAYLSDKGI